MNKGFLRAGHLPDPVCRLPLLRHQLHGLGAARTTRRPDRARPRPQRRREGPDGRHPGAGRRRYSAWSTASWSTALLPQAGRHHQPARRARSACPPPGISASTATSRCCWSAACSASPAPRSPSRCRSPRAGIRRSTRAPRWASPAPATPAPSSPPCSRRAWRFGPRLEQRARPRLHPARDRLRRLSAPRQGRPRRARPQVAARSTWPVLAGGDAWWFMFFYSVTFGGFVGLASSLTIYFNDQYGLSPVVAGYFTAACVFAGSLVRPLGGAVADRDRRRPLAQPPCTPSPRSRCSSIAHGPAASLDGARSSSSSPCWRSAWATAPCSSSCRSASAARSAS